MATITIDDLTAALESNMDQEKGGEYYLIEVLGIDRAVVSHVEQILTTLAVVSMLNGTPATYAIGSSVLTAFQIGFDLGRKPQTEQE